MFYLFKWIDWYLQFDFQTIVVYFYLSHFDLNFPQSKIPLKSDNLYFNYHLDNFSIPLKSFSIYTIEFPSWLWYLPQTLQIYYHYSLRRLPIWTTAWKAILLFCALFWYATSYYCNHRWWTARITHSFAASFFQLRKQPCHCTILCCCIRPISIFLGRKLRGIQLGCKGARAPWPSWQVLSSVCNR